MSLLPRSGPFELQELVSLAVRGRQEALDHLLRLLEGELLAFAGWKVRDPHLARDVVQESLIEIARGIAGLDDPSRVRSWALSIVAHNAVDALRKRTPVAPTPGREPDEVRIDRERILEALQRMPEEYRYALILRHLQGFRYAEIADALGIPIGTVRSRIARGEEALKRLWEEGS